MQEPFLTLASTLPHRYDLPPFTFVSTTRHGSAASAWWSAPAAWTTCAPYFQTWTPALGDLHRAIPQHVAFRESEPFQCLAEKWSRLWRCDLDDSWKTMESGSGNMRPTSEKDAKLAQKLGQLQPSLAVPHSKAWANSHLLGQPNTFLAIRLNPTGSGSS